MKNTTFQKNVTTLLKRNKAVTIRNNEILLITDALCGSYHDELLVRYLHYEILDANHYQGVGSNWEVDADALAAKIAVSPLGVRNSLLGDVREAWEFHKDDFFEFLGSRSYTFLPRLQDFHSATSVVGGELSDGSIVVDCDPSHVAADEASEVLRALNRIDPQGRSSVEEEVTFPKEVGLTKCVETTSGDQIVFAQRPNRKGLTRFVKGRAPEPTKSVFVVLKKERDHRYLLITGFIGGKPEPEPWDEKAFALSSNPKEARNRSIKFWDNHALVFSHDAIVDGTETTSP